MSDEDTDYEMEYEALQARLLPFADHMLAQLEDARMLANHQRADRDLNEWLDEPTQHPDTTLLALFVSGVQGVLS